MTLADKKHSSIFPFKFWTKPSFIAPLQPLLIWQSISLFWFCGIFAARYPIIGTSCAVIIFLIDTRLRQKIRLFTSILLFIIGFFILHSQIPARPHYPTWALDGSIPKIIRIEGTVSKVESLTNQRLRIYLRDTHSVKQPENILSGLVMWTWESKKIDSKLQNIPQHPKRPIPGQKVQISARIRTTEGFRNWGNNDFGFYLQSQGIFWRIWSRGNYGNPQIIGDASKLADIRNNALQSLEQAIIPSSLDLANIKTQARAFIPALLFGEKYFINQSTMENMRSASLVHSLALSGQHLAIVGLCAAVFASIMYMLWPQTLLILPLSKWIGILSLPLALLYLWVGNAPPSLIRAVCMLVLALIFYWQARMTTLIDILISTLLLITIYNPAAIFNLGLQLSVLCVGSISLIIPLLNYIPNPHVNLKNNFPLKFFIAKLSTRIIQIFIISLSIQLVLLPIFLYYFAPSGPWFMFNIIWLPILSLWVLPLGIIGTILIYIDLLTLSQHIFTLATWPCEILLQTLNFMHTHDLFNFPLLLRPHWTVFIAWIFICLALAIMVGRITLKDFFKPKHQIRLPHHKTLIFIAMSFLFLGPILRYAEYWIIDARIVMLDVGQGQAICISLHGGERILVDGGGSMSNYFDTGANLVIPRLTYNKPPRLWAAVATHPDMDHLRGLMAVLEKMQVANFYHNGRKMSTRYTKKLKAMRQKNKLPPTKILRANMQLNPPTTGNHFAIEVLNPQAKKKFSSNNSSIVLRLIHEKNNTKHGIAMLCGDAEIFAQQNMLKTNKNMNADIFIVPHHGSKDALNKDFFDAVQARVALVSSGINNNYAFPHHAIKNYFKQKNIPLYNTAKNGAISVTWHNINSYNFHILKNKPNINISTNNDTTTLALQRIMY